MSTQIYVATHTGETITLDVESIELVRAKVLSKEGIPLEQQRLTFPVENPKQAHDRKTVGLNYSTRTTPECSLVEPTGSIKIYVKTLTGKTIILEIQRSASILKIKSKINDKEGIRPKWQKLIYNGKHLDENLTVADYNIIDGSGLQLVFRVPGG